MLASKKDYQQTESRQISLSEGLSVELLHFIARYLSHSAAATFASYSVTSICPFAKYVVGRQYWWWHHLLNGFNSSKM